MSSPTDTSIHAAPFAAPTLDDLALAGEQPGWRVLDAARAQQFTGEVRFETQQAVSIYFDGGHAYCAVSAGDPSFCQRLIDAGVADPAQLERGVIRIGNVENLGRLFDRDPSIDRDAVMVVLELATDHVVTTVANTVTSSFSLTAYRHHASGVHRWFVAPSDQPSHSSAQLAPVGEVAQIDSSVTGDLPGFSGLADDDGSDGDGSDGDGPDESHHAGDEVHIEWDRPLDHDLTTRSAPLHVLDEPMLESIADAEVANDPPTSMPPITPVTPFAEETDEPSDLTAPTADVASSDSSSASETDLSLPEQVPAATSEIPIVDELDPEITHDVDVDVDVETAHDVDAEMSPGRVLDSDLAESSETPESATVGDAPEPESVPAMLSFELPVLTTTENSLPDDHQPDEVVDAVRRALEAIEAAAEATTRLASIALADLPSFEPNEPVPFEVTDPSVTDSQPSGEDDVSGLSDVTDPVAPVAPVEPVVDLPRADDESTARAVDAVAEPLAEAGTESSGSMPAATAHELVMTPEAVDFWIAGSGQEAAPVVEPVIETTLAPGSGFPPPTMNDSAEAVYARAAQDPFEAGPGSGVASVVFADEAPHRGNDRSGALKRLIGSLRRK